jgi:hypothetical protein
MISTPRRPEVSSGALEGAVYRCLSRVEDRGGFGSIEAENIPQDQRGPWLWAQMLQSGHERQRQRLFDLEASLGSGVRIIKQKVGPPCLQR